MKAWTTIDTLLITKKSNLSDKISNGERESGKSVLAARLVTMIYIYVYQIG